MSVIWVRVEASLHPQHELSGLPQTPPLAYAETWNSQSAATDSHMLSTPYFSGHCYENMKSVISLPPWATWLCRLFLRILNAIRTPAHFPGTTIFSLADCTIPGTLSSKDLLLSVLDKALSFLLNCSPLQSDETHLWIKINSRASIGLMFPGS